MNQVRKGAAFTALFSILLLSLLALWPATDASGAEEAAQPATATLSKWEALAHLSSGAEHGAFAPLLEAAPGGDRLIIVYNREESDGAGSPRTPFYVQSLDDGRTWTAPTPLTTEESDISNIALTFDSSGNGHAVWRSDSALFYAPEAAWGTAVTQTLPTPAGTTQIGFAPAIAVAPDDAIHIVWPAGDESKVHGIYHARLPSGADASKEEAWEITEITGANDHSAWPDVTVDAHGNVYVVWEESIFDSNNGRFEWRIYYKKGTLFGGNYLWPENGTSLSQNLNFARRPAVLAAGSTVHVMFEEHEQVEEDNDLRQITPRYNTQERGQTWTYSRQTGFDVSQGNPLYVNQNLPYFMKPTLALCEGELFVFYHGAPTLNAPEQIWNVRQSGSTWAPPEAITEAVNRYANPSFTCTDSHFHLTVEEIGTVDADHQIYYTNQQRALTVLLPFIRR